MNFIDIDLHDILWNKKTDFVCHKWDELSDTHKTSLFQFISIVRSQSLIC